MGPLVQGAAYLNVRNPNSSYFSDNPNGGVGVGCIESGFQRLRIGATTLGFTYSNTKFMSLSDTGTSYSGTTIFNNAEVSAKYRFAPALLVGLDYGAPLLGCGRQQKSDFRLTAPPLDNQLG
jgi:predicted porin